jgi:ribosomal protein S18 acetylase RimI-like enzyme
MDYRSLGPDDLAPMHALLSLFGRAFDDADTYDSARPDDTYLATLLGNPAFIAVVAFHDGTVVGGLTAYVLPKFEQARREIYIYDLAVDESFRRRGVATGLITKVREIATDRGAWVIYVQADRDDGPAVALYTKLGTREEVLHFDIPPQSRGAADGERIDDVEHRRS